MRILYLLLRTLGAMIQTLIVTYLNSTMEKSFFNQKMNVPTPDVINECPSTGEFLYFLVNDGAFPRRPYPRHVST